MLLCFADLDVLIEEATKRYRCVSVSVQDAGCPGLTHKNLSGLSWLRPRPAVLFDAFLCFQFACLGNATDEHTQAESYCEGWWAAASSQPNHCMNSLFDCASIRTRVLFFGCCSYLCFFNNDTHPDLRHQPAQAAKHCISLDSCWFLIRVYYAVCVLSTKDRHIMSMSVCSLIWFCWFTACSCAVLSANREKM